jgi:hypothetical protein
MEDKVRLFKEGEMNNEQRKGRKEEIKEKQGE